jgi:hypothetical protein
MSVLGYNVQRRKKKIGWTPHGEAIPCLSHACQVAAEIGTVDEPARVVNERGAVLYDSSVEELEPSEK